MGCIDAYICETCFLLLERTYRTTFPPASTRSASERSPIQAGKRRRTNSFVGLNSEFSDTVQSSPQHRRKAAESTSHTFKRRTRRTRSTCRFHHISAVLHALKKSQYSTALNHILKCGATALRHFNNVVTQQCKRQMRTFRKYNKHLFPELNGIQSVQDFSWGQMLTMMEQHTSTLLSACMGSVLKSSSWKSPRVGMMLSIALYHNSPGTLKFVQSLNSAQLWRSGCGEKVIQQLNHLGLCQSPSTTRCVVDRLITEGDAEIKRWKSHLEKPNVALATTSKLLLSCEEEQVSLSTCSTSDEDDYQPPSCGDSVEEFSDSSSCGTDTPKLSRNRNTVSSPHFYSTPEERDAGFALVWDNTQKLVKVCEACFDRHNKMHLWANAYAALNRVDVSHLEGSHLTLRASDINLTSYLPSQDDYHHLHQRMEVIVSRIICHHIPHFLHHYSDVVVRHIPHAHSEESSRKSKVINLGIIDANPSTREGTTKIMETLQKLVPTKPDGTFRVVPCHGDGLSVERMTDAKRDRAADHLSTDRLEGLEQTAQEFHHRGLMMQNTINLLYKGSSVTQRGTLAQIRNYFNHRNMTTDVMNSYNAVDDFLRFVTESFTVYLALKICDMENITDCPRGSIPRGSAPRRTAFLKQLCKEVVDRVWLAPTIDSIQDVLDAEVPKKQEWCFCDEEGDGPMVRCSNSMCPLGSWFHQSCLDLGELPNECDDWWCSGECRDTENSLFCHCKSSRSGIKVVCSNPSCANGQYFHLQCVELDGVPDGEWFCGPECSNKELDYVQNYSSSVLWCGLLDRIHHDMIREADGLAMMTMWRYNMTRFWTGGHTKYLIYGHRLLAGIQGFYPPRVMEEIIHNRTVNLRGGPGHNIAMDRVCEFLNADFKGLLSHSQGHWSPKTIERAGKLVGSVAASLDALYSTKVTDVDLHSAYHKKRNYQPDIERFVKEYKKDALFDNIPGRQHKSFSKFKHSVKIQNPLKLKQKLINHSEKLDRSISVNACL